MIDVLLVVLLVSYAVSGYRQGIAVGALSLVGFLGGALIAMWLVPPVAGLLPDGVARSVALLVAVLMIAWLGQLAGALLGGRLRDRLTLPAAKAVDQGFGAVAGVVAVSLVLWFIGGALREVTAPTIAKAVADSRVLAVIDSVVPQELSGLASQFRQVVSDSAFPRVFEGVAPEKIIPVPSPNPSAMPVAVQALVRQSVVKISGEAPDCGRGQEGSGVVVAAQRVITNAHVVAAVRNPTVQLAGGGPRYPATVVLFDPTVDLAVLAVPDLRAAPLRLGTDLARGDDAVVAGYPQNGPYTAVPARVRDVIRAKGEDIYNKPGAIRQVYSLYAHIEQGNSGGPLLSSSGAVSGLVFAKSYDDTSTGYALTMGEIRPELIAGIQASAPVSTGPCATG
jgi:S1-C subfamily serine protease